MRIMNKEVNHMNIRINGTDIVVGIFLIGLFSCVHAIVKQCL